MAKNNGNRNRRGPHADKLEAIQSVRQQLACAEAHLGLYEYEPGNDDLHEAAIEQVEAAQRQLADLLARLETPADTVPGAQSGDESTLVMPDREVARTGAA